jgi:hypothetical protein
LIQLPASSFSISESHDAEERQELLAAKAYLFEIKVKKLGYGPATRDFTGPAQASAEVKQSGVTDADGQDIENPT